jgi:hypothetical protein
MLNDRPTPYQWQDHVIPPRRAALDLIATALIVAVVATAALAAGHGPDTPPHVAAATEQTPPLSHLVKRPILPHARADALTGC